MGWDGSPGGPRYRAPTVLKREQWNREQILGTSKLSPFLPTLTRVNSYKRCRRAAVVVVEKKSRELERKQSVADIRLISFPGRGVRERVFSKVQQL